MRVTIHTELDTDVPSELIREALLDFTDRRLATWAKTLDPETYQVHWVGDTSAEVTEGSARPKVWSRERYDWSEPDTISWTTQESNFCTPGSRVVMQINPLLDGGSHIAVTWDRSPSNLRGGIYLGGAALGGRRLLTWATTRALGDLQRTLGAN
jgi:hypothetical protein